MYVVKSILSYQNRLDATFGRLSKTEIRFKPPELFCLSRRKFQRTIMCLLTKLPALLLIVFGVGNLTICKAGPVVTQGSELCGDTWFHGYQSLGITYTVGDSNTKSFAIGGSVPSGCSTLAPAQTPYLNDQCAVLEYFATYTQPKPTFSVILSTFPYQGIKLGITGLLALSKSKNPAADSVIGVVQLGIGQQYSSNPTQYQPDGTELAIYEVSGPNTINYYYISDYFKGFSCGVNKKTIDRYGGSTVATIAFQQCLSPKANYVLQFKKVTSGIQVTSFTKFEQSSLLQWYQVTNDGRGNGFLLTGKSISNSVPALRWLVTQTNGSSTDVSSPKCNYNLMFDQTWDNWIDASYNLIPAFTSWASFLPAYEAAVVLHDPTGSFPGFALILTWLDVCQSNFDLWYYDDAQGPVTVLDMQIFYNDVDLVAEVKVLAQARGSVWIVNGIQNRKDKGWRNSDAKSYKIEIREANGVNQALFTFSLLDVDLSSAFMFKNSDLEPNLFGVSNKYWNGINDGFMWRKSSLSCLEYNIDSPLSRPFKNRQHQICAYKPPSTIDNHYLNNPICNNPQAQRLTGTSGILVSPTPQSFIQTLNVAGWTTTSSYSVKNPCMMQVTGTVTSPQIVQLGVAARTASITFTQLVDNCPFYAYQLSSTKLDYSLVKVERNTAPIDQSLLIARYSAPNYLTPFQYQYDLLQVTDFSLVGTWTATFRLTIQGDMNSDVFNNPNNINLKTVQIQIKGCTPTKTTPITLAPVTANIGPSYTTTVNLSTAWQNGDCAYSTQPDTSQIWPAVSSYQKEVLVLTGTVLVVSTTTSPILTIQTNDQNLEGTYTYTFKYTDYKGTIQNVPMQVTLVSTECKYSVSGLQSISAAYHQSILNTTAIPINVSTVRNNQCGYQLDIQQLSGPKTAIFISAITQPQFQNSNPSWIRNLITPGSVQINALTGTIPEKQAEVGVYQFQLLVKHELAPFAVLGVATFSVEISDCENVWNPTQNLTQVDYYLNQVRTIEIPAFVNTSLITCNSVTTTYKCVSGIDLSSALTIQQNSSVLGSGLLTIESSDYNLRNTHTLEITSTDTTGASLSFFVTIIIKHNCDDTIVTPFPFFEQIVTLSYTNQSSQTVQIPQFQQTITECNPFVYDYSLKQLSGPPTTNLLSIDSSTLLLTIAAPTTKLNGPSTVGVTISGQVLGLQFLPKKEANFKVILVPEVVFVAPVIESPRNISNSTVKNLTVPATNYTQNFTIRQRDQTPLVPQIVSISSTGEVRIKFNRNLIIPSFYSNVTKRRKEPDYIETIDQYLNLKVKSGIDNPDTNRTKIIKFNLTDYQKSFLILQVDFLNPDLLSPSYNQPDLLYVKFTDATIFISETQVILANDTQINRPIPTQLSQVQATQVAQLTATVSSGMNTIATINLVLNILLSFGLKYLWNFVNLLQFLVFIPKWKLNIPQNALTVLLQLKAIALMEFIPTKQITSTISSWFAMDPDDESNIFNGMGLMLLIAVLIVLVVIALGVTSYLVQKNYSAYKTYRRVREAIFYNAFLRYMLQSVLKIGLASSATLSTITWSPFAKQQTVSVLTSSLILLVFGLSPIIFAAILKINYNRLPRPSAQKQIGTLYLSIRDTDTVALAYTPIFMLRRLLFIAITFGMSDQPGLQIHLFSYLSLIYIMFLGIVMPHDLLSMTTQEMVNESILMLACYHFILFSGVIFDQELRTNIGWSLTAFIGALLLFNVSVILNANFQQLYRKYKIWRLKREAKAALSKKISTIFSKNQSLPTQPNKVVSNQISTSFSSKPKESAKFVRQSAPKNEQNKRSESNDQQLKLEEFSFREKSVKFQMDLMQQPGLKLRNQTQEHRIAPTKDDIISQQSRMDFDFSREPVYSVQSSESLFVSNNDLNQAKKTQVKDQFLNEGQYPQSTQKMQIRGLLDQSVISEYEKAQLQFQKHMAEKTRAIKHLQSINQEQKSQIRF